MTAPALFFAAPSQASAELRADAMLPAENSAVTQEAADSLVGEFARRTLSEAEIDAHIKSLGDLADRAYKAGDKDAARSWTDQMMAAIRGRSPAHKARLEAEVMRRIDELTFDGIWAQEMGSARV